MSIYELHLRNGETKTVEADDLSEAADFATIFGWDLHELTAFTRDGNRVQVFGQSRCCICSQHVQEGTSCEHDLKLVGIVFPF